MPNCSDAELQSATGDLDRDAQYFEQLTAERIRTRYVKG
jgi:hypothetical protein